MANVGSDDDQLSTPSAGTGDSPIVESPPDSPSIDDDQKIDPSLVVKGYKYDDQLSTPSAGTGDSPIVEFPSDSPSIDDDQLIDPPAVANEYEYDDQLIDPSAVAKENEFDDRPFIAKIDVQRFSYDELKAATNNFVYDKYFLGDGSYGDVFPGTLSSGQLVAVKKMTKCFSFESKNTFLVEALMLPRLKHTNIIDLIGCCMEGNQRILVYELMSLGSLQKCLDGSARKPLEWNESMAIAHGAAQGLAYLHHSVVGPIIHRDINPCNILLDEGLLPKISDFGLAMYGPDYHGDDSHIFTKSVCTTHEYSAPELSQNNANATTMSDVYSFGVTLFKLFTARCSLDLGNDPEHLVINDKDLMSLADPQLDGKFPEDIFREVMQLVLNCSKNNPELRPSMTAVVATLKELKSHVYHDKGSSEDQSSAESEMTRSLSSTHLGASALGNKGQNINPYMGRKTA